MNQNFREHARDTLEKIYRDESRRVLATLIRLLGISIWRSRRSERIGPHRRQVPIGTAPADEAGLSPVSSTGVVSIGSFELSRWRLRRMR